LLSLLLLWLATACGGGQEQAPSPAQPTLRFSTGVLTAMPAGYRLEIVLDGLVLPTSLAATPDGRLLIAEQETGNVRVVKDGRLLDEPWFHLSVSFYPKGFFHELGLVGIAVDPLFEGNSYVYVYYTDEGDDGTPETVLARLKDVDGHGTELKKLLTIERVPEKQHIAGGIAFDGDEAILVGIGDHERAELAPRLDSPLGKVLRIDREGNALPDNPFVGRQDANPRVYAYGLRNPFGLAVDLASGRKFFTDNRNVPGDAVYELEAGADYGWPTYPLALREPLIIYREPVGMAGITVYNGTALPAFEGDLFFCTFHDNALHWSDPGELVDLEIIRRDRIIGPGCGSGVAEGADGFLYYLSYGDGKLLRISR
jgi:glucose/arabinose dehydrogenase